MVGQNHSFGFNRSGNSDFLLKYCNDNQIKLDIVNPVKNKTKIVSSTHIRELIKLGNVNYVKPFLGRFYSFTGTIIKGSGRGNKLKFPTANKTPKENFNYFGKGVYFVSKHYWT